MPGAHHLGPEQGFYLPYFDGTEGNYVRMPVANVVEAGEGEEFGAIYIEEAVMEAFVQAQEVDEDVVYAEAEEFNGFEGQRLFGHLQEYEFDRNVRRRL